MKKRFFSILLTWILAVSLVLPVMPVKAETSGTTKEANVGQFRVNLAADPATNAPVGGEDGFGTKESAGRIWTDKSVAANADGSFGVTLSALAQEYKTTVNSSNPGVGGSTTALEADVTFVLDMSTSMSSNTDIAVTDDPKDTNKYSRIQAMAMAANDAIKIVMEANPKNRVAVYWFGGAATSNHLGTFLQMNSYTFKTGFVPSNAPGNVKSYLNFDNNKTIAPSSNLNQSTGGASTPTAGGTPTQDGMMFGVNNTINNIKSSTRGATDSKRKPYVFILSDGAASIGRTAWYQVPSSYTSGASLTGDTNNGSADVAAVTILTGMYMKKQLETAYGSYNGEPTEAKFYTVGLGPDNAINGTGASEVFAWAGLDPKTLYENRENSSFRKNSAVDTQTKIKAYTSGTYASYSASTKVTADNYIYSDYYKWAPNYKVVQDAFRELSGDVASATAILPLLNIPVSTGLSGSETTDMDSAIAIADEIGNAFDVDLTTLKIGDAVAKENTAKPINNGMAYKFDGYKSEAVIKTVAGVKKLIWYIDADDMATHIYRFKDRSNPQDGQYAEPAKGSFQLTYNLKPTLSEEPGAVATTAYFLNSGSSEGAATVAYFLPPDDSPYYNNLQETRITDKADQAGSIGAPYISEETLIPAEGAETNDRMEVKLGNNGRLDLDMGIVKSGPKIAQANSTINYTVTVYNYTDKAKNGINVTSEGTSKTVDIPAKGIAVLTFPANAGPVGNLVSTPATITDLSLNSNTVTTQVAELPSYLIAAAGVTGNDSNSGIVSGGGTYMQDSNVTITAVPEEGYRFVGWYTDAAGTQEITNAGASYTFKATAAGTYYAKFEKLEFTVTTNAGSGGAISEGGTYDYGTTVIITAEPNDGYEFHAFTVSSANDGVVYTVSGASLTIGSLTDNVTVSASFLARGKLTFNYNGATDGNAETERTVTEGSTLGTLPEPTRDGYTFGGWENAEGILVTADTLMPEEGIAVTARWTPNPYAITLVGNNGTENGTLIKNYNDTINAVPSITCDGYAFGGWYSDSELAIPVVYPYLVTGDSTWYAKWVKNQNSGYVKAEVLNPEGDTVIAKDSQYTLSVYDGETFMGSTDYTATDTDAANGKFTVKVDNLPDGDYTAVLQYSDPNTPGDTTTITDRVVVKDGIPNPDPLVMKLSYRKNTKLVLKDNTPNVTVSGLNIIYNTDNKDVLSDEEKTLITTDGSNTTITLTAAKLEDNASSAADLSNLKKTTVDQITALYMDLTLNKHIVPASLSEVNLPMADSGILLTISIPLPTVPNATNFRVYREHEKKVTEIGQGIENANAAGEYCEPITGDHAVLHVRYFSIYAFTYTTGSGSTNPGNGDSGSGNGGTTNPGSGDTGSGNGGTTTPGSGGTGSGNGGTTNPGSGDTGSGNGGTTTPGSGDTGSGNGGTTNPGSGNGGTTTPGTSDTGTNNSGATNTGTKNPKNTGTGTTNAGTTKPKVTKPDSSKSNTQDSNGSGQASSKANSNSKTSDKGSSAGAAVVPGTEAASNASSSGAHKNPKTGDMGFGLVLTAFAGSLGAMFILRRPKNAK